MSAYWRPSYQSVNYHFRSYETTRNTPAPIRPQHLCGSYIELHDRIIYDYPNALSLPKSAATIRGA